MRIISGKFKGRVIKMPKGIRPTQDKVRKALFDILGDIKGLSFLELFAGSGAVGFEAISRSVADVSFVEHNRDALLTINKNIESLGLTACQLYPLEAEKAIRVFHKDKRHFDIIFLDPPYPKNLIPRPYSKLYKRGSGSTGNLQEQPLFPRPYDKLDKGGSGSTGDLQEQPLSPPPYSKLYKRGSGSTGDLQEQPLSKKTLQILGAYDILAPCGYIVVQHFKKDNLPEALGDLALFKQKRYGDTVLSFYTKCAK